MTVQDVITALRTSNRGDFAYRLDNSNMMFGYADTDAIAITVVNQATNEDSINNLDNPAQLLVTITYSDNSQFGFADV